MSVTVKQINELCLRNKDLETIIKEQLQIIDDKLLHSDRSIGNNCITHSLPTTMPSVVGVDRQDAQRIVYSNIIYSLEKRGFTVKITLNNSSSILYVSWKSEIDKQSVETMNSIIRNSRISKEELHNLVYKKN
jgi:hypothetical protein